MVGTDATGRVTPELDGFVTFELELGDVGTTGVTVGVETATTAFLLVTIPAELVATTAYVPASAAINAGNNSVAVVAPEIDTPFFVHWSDGTGIPVTSTLNSAPPPAKTV